MQCYSGSGRGLEVERECLAPHRSTRNPLPEQRRHLFRRCLRELFDLDEAIGGLQRVP